MQVQSTGLGKTVLTSHVAGLLVNNENKDYGLTLKIEATEPVHWYITCQLEGSDLRTVMKMVLKPSVLFRVLKMIFQKSSSAAAEPAEGRINNG